MRVMSSLLDLNLLTIFRGLVLGKVFIDHQWLLTALNGIYLITQVRSRYCAYRQNLTVTNVKLSGQLIICVYLCALRCFKFCDPPFNIWHSP